MQPGIDANIALKPGKTLSPFKPILMTLDKEALCRAEQDRLRAADFIETWTAAYAASAFFIKDNASSSRGDAKDHRVIDYRALKESANGNKYVCVTTRETGCFLVLRCFKGYRDSALSNMVENHER